GFGALNYVRSYRKSRVSNSRTGAAMKAWAFCLFAFAIGSMPAAGLGQVTSAAGKGRVIDSQDAVIACATVYVWEMETGVKRVTESELDGQYRLESLAPGQYQLEVSTPGFKVESYDVTLRAGDQLTLDFQLNVHQLTETVVVNTQISGINTSD